MARKRNIQFSIEIDQEVNEAFGGQAHAVKALVKAGEQAASELIKQKLREHRKAQMERYQQLLENG